MYATPSFARILTAAIKHKHRFKVYFVKSVFRV